MDDTAVIFLFAMLLAVGIGSYAGAFLKALNEIALAGKAASVGDVRDGGIGLCDEEILRARNAQMMMEFLEGLVGNSVEIGVDLGDADVKFCGDLSGGQRLVKMLNQVLDYVENIIVWRIETDGSGVWQEAVRLSQDQHQKKEGSFGIGILAALLQQLHVSLDFTALGGSQLQNQTVITEKPVAMQKAFGNLLDKLLVEINAMANIALLGGVKGVNVMIGACAVQNEGGGGDFLSASVVEDLSLRVAGNQKQLGEVMHMGILVDVVESLGDPLDADGTLLGRISELRFVRHRCSSFHHLFPL